MMTFDPQQLRRAADLAELQSRVTAEDLRDLADTGKDSVTQAEVESHLGSHNAPIALQFLIAAPSAAFAA